MTNDKIKEVKEEKKSIFAKAKDAILPDPEEQAAIISTFVRITVLAWSGGILTLNYVAIPGVPQQKIDPTFIASVFTGVLATFGVQAGSKKNNGASQPNGSGGVGITKADLEKLIAAAKETAPAQTIRVEQGPIKIIPADPKENYKL